MENSDSEDGGLKHVVRRKGGLRTMPFVIANEAFEKIASYGLQPNMILYLVTVYHFSVTGGISILFVWSAISNFMPVLGAFFSDSYFGRFLVISGGTLTSFMGLGGLWLTSVIGEIRSSHCGDTPYCTEPNAGQVVLLFTSFALLSIGAGGVRPCSIAFGADQFDNPSNPKNARILQSFFSWYYASLGVSLILAVTVIVYIQTKFGWVIGFGVPLGLMFFSVITFFMGSRLYVKVKPNKSLLTSLAQVVAASLKNRHIDLSTIKHDYHHGNGSKCVAPTNELRYLNKACIIKDANKDLNTDGSASNPWRLCSVLQVEVLKSLINILPIWSTGIMIAVTVSQHSFPVLQAGTLNRQIGSFKIPAGSFGLFGILTLTIWVALYDRVFVPLISKHTGDPRGISVKTRIGIGLFLSCLATSVAALVEGTRRNRALHEGLAGSPKAQVNMSAMWIIPQHCLTGLAEAFNAIGQIELYYSQFPRSMASISVALFALGMAIGNLLAALLLNIVNVTSQRGGGESWVSSNLNKGHYDYYYWIITALSVVNFVYYILCSRSYRCRDEQVWDEVMGDHEDKIGEVDMVDVKKSRDSLPSEYFSL